MNYTTVEKIIKKNKRSLDSTDAQYHYANLVQEGYSEILSFKLNKLFDLLKFSAAEMWISPRELKTLSISTKEVDSYLKKLPKGIKTSGYYSDLLTKTLIKLYKPIKNKKYENLTDLERHLSKSLSKEIFCYRAYKVSTMKSKEF